MSFDNIKATFDAIDIGSPAPTSVPMETVVVKITSTALIENYAIAFVNEGWRVNPLRALQVDLTKEEVIEYAKYLLNERVKTVHYECKDWRKLKALYVPAWIQYSLSMVGKVYLRDIGIILDPEMSEEVTYTYEDALKVSEKIGAFERDLQIFKDAMPRGEFGNKDVMSTALIADYMRSIDKVDHVASTYVAAFLGFKLKEEQAFQAIYRVQYDDIAFITAALATQKGLY